MMKEIVAVVQTTESENNHQIHIWTERERRKKMRNMFSSLRDLLPAHNLPLKADKSCIVDEAIKHIKILEYTVKTLQKQKLDKLRTDFTSTKTVDQDQQKSTKSSHYIHHHQAHDHDQSRESLLEPQAKNFRTTSFQTWLSSNVVVNISGDDAQISICSLRKPGLLATIFFVLERHNVDVISSHVSSDLCRSFIMIHAHASGACEEFVKVENVFKLAATEINLWILSCQ